MCREFLAVVVVFNYFGNPFKVKLSDIIRYMNKFYRKRRFREFDECGLELVTALKNRQDT